MLRGSIGNTLSPSVWVHSDVVLQYAGRMFFVGPKKYEVIRSDFLWALSERVKPIIVYINQEPNRQLVDYEHLRFNNFNECRETLRRDQRVIEMVVDDPTLVSNYFVQYTASLSRKYRR